MLAAATAITNIILGGASAVVGTVGASTAVAIGSATFAVVNAGLGLAASAAISLATTAMQPKVQSSGAAIEWTADPDAPLHFPFGRVGVAGQIVHNAVFGPDSMYVGFVGVVGAAGPIDSFVNFKANNQLVSFDGNGMATSTEFANEMWLKRQTGAQPTSTAMAISGLKSGASMPGWSSSYKLSGKAAYQLVMGENSKRTAYGGKVPTILHTLRGLKCWDPRLDSTYPGGSGTCLLNNPSTWVYTTNAYLHALKWSLGLWEGPTLKGAPAHDSTTDYQVGGIGARIGGVVVQDYVEGANAFDDNDDWACAAWPSTDDDKAAVLDSFLQAGGGIYAQKAGKIGCVHRLAPRASVATITGTDTAGPIELTLATPRKDRINTIRPRYWSEAHQWQMTAAVEVTSTVWQEEDGQGSPVKRTRGIDYNYVPNAKQAAQLAALQIANTREGIKGVIPLRPYMMGLEVGDCVTLDEPDFVLDGQKVLILDIDDQTEADIIRVSFVSETDGKYPFAYGQTESPPPAPELDPDDITQVNGPLPGEWTITPRPPDGSTQQPGFNLEGAISNARASRVLVEYGPASIGPWKQAYEGPPTSDNIPLDNLAPGATYYVAITYFNAWGNPSDKAIYGPYTAPSLISEDTANVDGIPSPDFKTRLISAEALGETNSAAVNDILAGYPTITDAVADAEAARDVAVVKAGEASDDATATAGSASVAVAAQGGAETAAAAALGHATTAETEAGEAETFAQQSSEARDESVAASITSGTHVETAEAAAATSAVQASVATDKALEATDAATIAVSVGSTSSVNLAQNPSGYDGLSGYAQDFGGLWYFSEADGPGLGYLATNIPTGPVDRNLYQAVAIGGQGGPITVSCEVYFSSGAGYAVLGSVLSSGANKSVLVTPNAWQRVFLSFTAGERAGASTLYAGPTAYGASGGLLAFRRLKIEFSPTPSAFSEDRTTQGLAASVTELSNVTADLEDQYVLARYQVAAVTGGGAAILSLLSDNYGSVAGLTADQVYLGEDTYFDNATNTWRTVVEGIAYVRAEGASFGTDGTLRLWFGPSTVAFSAMSRANAYFCFATAEPHIDGTGLRAATQATRGTGVSGAIGLGAATTPSGSVTLSNVPAGGSFRIQITGKSMSNSDGSLALATGSIALTTTHTAGTIGGDGTTSASTSATTATPIAGEDMIISNPGAGSATFSTTLTGGGGATSSTGSFTGVLSVTYLPA